MSTTKADRTSMERSIEILPTEDQEQEALIQWCMANGRRYKGLDRIFAIPNGGYRDKRNAVTLKRTGTRSGVPDLCIPVPMGRWHGMYIEMKRRKYYKVSDEQKDWLGYLQSAGYMAVVAYGFDDAVRKIQEYWRGSK